MRLDRASHDMLLDLRKHLCTDIKQQDLDGTMEGFVCEMNAEEKEVVCQMLQPKDVFHATNYMPMDPAGLEIDSEDEIDEDWAEEKDNEMLDQFADVGEADKEFMKLWNHYRTQQMCRADVMKMVSDQLLLEYLFDFVLQFRDLLNERLRPPFTLHLLALWEMGLLDGGQIETYLSVVAEEDELVRAQMVQNIRQEKATRKLELEENCTSPRA